MRRMCQSREQWYRSPTCPSCPTEATCVAPNVSGAHWWASGHVVLGWDEKFGDGLMLIWRYSTCKLASPRASLWKAGVPSPTFPQWWCYSGLGVSIFWWYGHGLRFLSFFYLGSRLLHYRFCNLLVRNCSAQPHHHPRSPTLRSPHSAHSSPSSPSSPIFACLLSLAVPWVHIPSLSFPKPCTESWAVLMAWGILRLCVAKPKAGFRLCHYRDFSWSQLVKASSRDFLGP